MCVSVCVCVCVCVCVWVCVGVFRSVLMYNFNPQARIIKQILYTTLNWKKSFCPLPWNPTIVFLGLRRVTGGTFYHFLYFKHQYFSKFFVPSNCSKNLVSSHYPTINNYLHNLHKEGKERIEKMGSTVNFPSKLCSHYKFPQKKLHLKAYLQVIAIQGIIRQSSLSCFTDAVVKNEG